MFFVLVFPRLFFPPLTTPPPPKKNKNPARTAEWHLEWNPYGRVPTLAWHDGGGQNEQPRSLYESLIANEWVNDASGGRLLPRDDPAAAAGCRLLIDQFSQKFGAGFGGLLFSEDGGEKAAEAAAKVDEALAYLEANTAGGSSAPASSGSPAPLFLLGGNGGAFTLADAAIYPFVSRLANVMPRLSPKSAGKYADLAAAGFPKVAAWLAATAAREGVRRTEVVPQGKAGTFWEALEETYVEYRARQRAAAAAAAK